MKQSNGLNLSDSTITDVCNEIEKSLKKKKVSSKIIVKIRLKVEETMQFYQNQFGSEASCSVKYSLNGLNKRITLFFEGEKIKPFKDNEDEFLNELMKVLGEPDNWQYKHNTNIVEFKIPQQPLSQVVQIGIALLCVALFTLLSVFVIPDNINESIQSVVLSPLSGLFLNILRSAACILIFTSIVTSVVNIGDIRSFKKIGKALFSNLFIFMFLSVAATLVSLTPWIHFSFGNSSGSSGLFADLYKTILDMIPVNPISPFIEGNAVQVIILAIFCGIIFSILGEKVEALKTFLQEFDVFISSVIEKISSLLPFLVFTVLTDTLLNNKISDILSQKTIVLMWVIAIALQFALNIVFVSVFGKMSALSYFKKAKSTLLITLFTSSSVAALPSNMSVCKNKFNIRGKLVDFGVPIGQVMFMPCSAAVMIATCVGSACISGVAVSPAWILTVIVISIIMSVATPPIPGAALMIYSLLFSQMGLPSSCFGVAIALVAVTDSIVTTLNVISLHYLLMKTDKQND